MDLYTILGLVRDASTNEVKRAYRRLARQYHPDINPGDRAAEALFRQIVEAYETLSDPDRRRRYDAGGESSGGSEDAAFEFLGFDFSVVAEGPQASTFGDFFADVLQQPAADAAALRPQDGEDLHAQVALDFEDMLHGAERQVTVTRIDTCPTCHGAGALRAGEARCGHCQGGGTVRLARGHMVFTRNCRHCDGTGRRRHRACQTCAASGVQPRTDTLTVRVPAGIADRASVRVPGRGNVGRRGGRPGDLYVSVRIAPHQLFQRDGDDLHLVLPIAVHEAALGAKVDVPSPEGPVRLRVPPGTQSGQRFRLRERGVPSAREGRRGDLVVEARLVLPRIVDERSKELLREFGRINGENVRKDLGV